MTGRIVRWILCLLAAAAGCDRGADRPASAPAPAGADEATLASIERGLAAREYDASPVADGLQAPNRAQNLRTWFEPAGIRVHDRTADGSPELLRLTLAGVGRGPALAPVEPGAVRADGARVEIARPGLVEWYRNGPDGLEQGFTLESRPAGAESDPVVLSLGVGRARARLRDERVILETEHGRRLQYARLAVRDAHARPVPARFAVDTGERIELVIDDAGASYPLVVDPLLSGTSEATLEGDQSGSSFGSPAVTAGDIDGDGFGDVIVSAPAYDAGESNEGAVFIFYGSATGIASAGAGSAVRIESDQANATLGIGTTAGDVNGDGYGDVIVGACGYDVVAGANEGAAFVFHGGPTGIASQTVATANTTLLGDQAGGGFCRGRTIGDVNGDGYGDIVVGAAFYDAPDVDEGAEFIFYGSATGIADGGPGDAVTQLESDQAGAQFGSGGNAGDVNGDGYSDVVLAAPRFSNPEMQEGVVFVYHGGLAGLTGAGVLESNLANALFGSAVSTAGDFNGDGYSDVIVGAPSYSNGELGEGAAFLFLGSATGLSEPVATLGPRGLDGGQIAGGFGGSASGIGDVNGDGLADLLIGSSTYDDGANVDAGRAVLVLGSKDGVMTPGVETVGQAGSRYGSTVAPAGDVNGDGFRDALIAAPFWDQGEADEGAAFVFLGSATGIVAAGDPGNAAAQLESDQVFANLGYSAASAGDVNGDGYGDVIVGAPYYDAGESDEGAAFVFLGSATGIVAAGDPGNAAARLESNQPAVYLGGSVASAGDVNGDGYGDVIVGAPYYDAGESDEGAAFVFLGSATGIVAAGDPGNAAAQLESDQGFAFLGSSVASAGDVNGDGYGDVIVGAELYDAGESNEGAAFVFLGSPTGIVAAGDPGNAAAQLESDQGSALLGSSVASAGDVNGDGYGDVIVGALYYAAGESDEGAAFVFLGSPTGIDAAGDPGNAAARLESNQPAASLGWSVASAGDVNGDGYGDVIVGAYRFDAGEVDGGAAFVYLGSATGIVTAGDPGNAAAQLNSYQAYAYLGYGVASAGDVNGDGYGDVIVGAPYYDAGESDEGAAFVYLGSATGIVAVGHPYNAAAQLESDQVNANLGWSAASAGDVNGDGYGDVIVGAAGYDAGESDEGAAFVFLGNGGRPGRPVLARQLSQGMPDAPVQAWGLSLSGTEFLVRMQATHPEGRGRAKLEVETCAAGLPFGSLGCTLTLGPTWTDVGIGGSGATLSETVSGLLPSELYRWRARVLRAPFGVTAPGITPAPYPAHGPWRRFEAQRFSGDIRMLPDLDGDGVHDALDNCPVTANPGQTDSDSDSLGEACDNCPLAANADQADLDLDGSGDVCDEDIDGDGLTQSEESLLGTNPLLVDTDADGLGDGAEVAAGTLPLDPDSDDDGALDGPDNCKLVANASQSDQDADAVGDVCDNCPRTTNPAQADSGGIGGGPDGVGSDCQNADFNEDGVVDLLDTVLLRRRLAGLEPDLDPAMPPAP